VDFGLFANLGAQFSDARVALFGSAAQLVALLTAAAGHPLALVYQRRQFAFIARQPAASRVHRLKT
jgi:hypothetical protein